MVIHWTKSGRNHQELIIIEIVQSRCPAIVFNALKTRAIIKLLTVHKRPSALATMNACIWYQSLIEIHFLKVSEHVLSRGIMVGHIGRAG